MLAKEINPFIRNALISFNKPMDKFVINADCRLFYIINGRGSLTVENKCFDFESDTMLIWKSKTRYRWEFSEKSECELAIINFDYTRDFDSITEPFKVIPCDNEQPSNIITCEKFEDICQLNSPICLKNAYMFRQEVLDIISGCNVSTFFSKELAESKLRGLIVETVQHLANASVSNSNLSRVLEYIQANFAREITLAELGELLNYHPNYVNLLMKKYIGMTLHAYITKCRMTQAAKLLVNTDKSVEDISTSVGYKNPSHFYKNFKQSFGVSPTDYRRSTILI